jgi:hypothetical protein
MQYDSLFAVGFNKFCNILFSNIRLQAWSEGVSEALLGGSPDSGDCGSQIILYSASSHAPKSSSLHRREQNGKNFASSGRSCGNNLTTL